MTSFVTRDAETKIVAISLPHDLLHQIDVARGVESRSSFIRRATIELMKSK